VAVALSMLLSLAALALFALATGRHYRQVFGRLPTARQKLAYRVLASLLLVAAPLPWIAETRPAIALVTWLFCGLPLAGVIVVAMFTALPHRDQS